MSPKDEDFNNLHLFRSLITLVLSGIIFSSTIINPLVSHQLIESDILNNSRYAIVFEAHEAIGEFNKKVTAIGSSIIRDAVDGKCISKNLSTKQTVGVFNLGISGANPYTEMTQIPALISSQPDAVIIELGPNNLWKFHGSESIDDYIKFRFTINSIQMDQKHIGEWIDIIREKDKQYVANNHIERLDMTKQYSLESIEYTIAKFTNKFFNNEYTDSDIPYYDNELWLEYLMTPNYKSPNFELKSEIEVKNYFSENMDKISSSPIYTPQKENTLNHEAYEYMLDMLSSRNIPVILLGLPHHPQVYPYLKNNQLDNYNYTFDDLSNRSGVYGVNMFWEHWPEWMFRDRNHLGDFGREYACKRISGIISDLIPSIESNINSDISIDAHITELDNCLGNDETTSVNSSTVIINAESYSFCRNSIDQRYPHSWIFMEEEGYMQSLPDIGRTSQIIENRAMIGFNLSLNEPGWYYFWLESRGESNSDDTIAINFNRSNFGVTNYSFISTFDLSPNEWLWTNNSTMAPLKMWVPNQWNVSINIWMVEDGLN